MADSGKQWLPVLSIVVEYPAVPGGEGLPQHGASGAEAKW